ncbi:MAG: alpha-1,2-fucosyltransferase [Kiritimatiellia bacterium]
MVIVSLTGGLGNQLFQYAAGRAVALRQRTSLLMDITAFEIYTLRAYRLSNFNIQESIAHTGWLPRLFGRPTNRYLRSLRRRLPYFWLQRVKERTQFAFDPDIFKNGRHVLLEGFWQNERYFREIAPLLRDEFSLRNQTDRENADMAVTIRNVNAVSIHVRRTDYVMNVRTAQTHGACSAAYYQAAMQMICANVRDPHFFVFSDDAAWAKNNLQFATPVTFVTHNQAERDYEDLRLMTLCRHHIIANSSFSWWGAWLGTNPGRIVIAPKRWFADETVDTSGLVPNGWRKI